MVSQKLQIARWESQRREALAGVAAALDAEGIDLDMDPLAFLAILDSFVAGQDYGDLDDDEWVWLHTTLAAYVAQVLIVEFGAEWDIVEDARRSNYVLRVTGRDGLRHAVSPMDVVHEDFNEALPPIVPRILAKAELAAGVSVTRR
ncbi:MULTISPECIES: DUF3806 domain-containing protein [Nocardia]|uniref:DUF3806 domain-containing protein n=1 Tax=Nocardia TaxID=1817 RepID=UPI001300AE37|nr:MULTISPECIES: DUF3806 domain-containing protein [Nocardia]